MALERVVNPADQSVWVRVKHDRAATAFARGKTILVCGLRDSSPFAPYLKRTLEQRMLTKRDARELLDDRLDAFRKGHGTAVAILVQARYFMLEEDLALKAPLKDRAVA